MSGMNGYDEKSQKNEETNTRGNVSGMRGKLKKEGERV